MGDGDNDRIIICHVLWPVESFTFLANGSANFMKYLFLLLLAVIVWLAWKKGQKRPLSRRDGERPVEAMVVCARCQIHLPESESLSAEGLHYCCREHLAAGPAHGGR